LTGFLVVSVDYRLAPEYVYPAALDDAAVALRWVHGNINEYGGDPKTIILAGESTGGTLAAALTALNYDNRFTLRQRTHKLNFKLSGLLLMYPPLQYDVFRPSHFKHRTVNGLMTLDQLLWFWSLYLGGRMAATNCAEYTVCPLLTPRNVLSRFPQTALVLAKHDVVLDEGVALYEALQAVKVQADLRVYNDTVHGFWATFDYTSSFARSNKFIQEQLWMMASWRKVVFDDNTVKLLAESSASGSSAGDVKRLGY
jgi:acetyl esterase